MPDNKTPFEVLPAADTTAHPQATRATPPPSLSARLAARLRPAKYDRQLAVGVPAMKGTPLAAHEARLKSLKERKAVARALRRAVTDAHDGLVLSSRVPLNIPNLTAAEDLIDDVTLRLHSPQPVNARGMARLRQILSDGTGPFYRFGRGDLRGRLGAALAAL
jgi:hypothetical protein